MSTHLSGGGAKNWLKMNHLEFHSNHPHGCSWAQYNKFLVNTLFSYFKKTRGGPEKDPKFKVKYTHIF